MRVKLTGFSQEFEREITRHLFQLDIGLSNNDTYDYEVVIDPKLNQIEFPHKTILALVEPQVVRPDLYQSQVFRKVAGVFPLSYYRAQRLELEYWFDFPVKLPRYIKDNRNRTKNIAIVNEHKFSGSARSQYGFRRSIIKYLEKNHPNELSLYGVEWQKGKVIELRRRIYALKQNLFTDEFNVNEVFSDLWHNYKLLSGHMHEDCEDLQSFNLSIVAENDLDYISEKVWKSLYAGAVPIYVGPDLSNDINLKDCVIMSKANLESVANCITTIDEKDLIRMRNNFNDFFSDIESTKYGLEATSTHFANSLHSLISRF